MIDVDDQGASAGDPFAGGDPTVEWAAETDARDPDPDAPWGRRPDGRPWTMSPEQRKAMGERLAEGRRASLRDGRAAPKRGRRDSRAPSTRPARQKAPQGPDYRQAVAGLLQLPGFALGFAGKFSPALGLDSAALALHTPNVADAVHHLALDEPRVAAILDRIMSVGPYGALIAAVSPLILQILCNHRMIPPNETMGTLGPDDLLAAIGVPPEEE